MKKLILKPGREKSLLRKHPWVFSGAVERVEGNPDSGETVLVRSSHGAFLGWAAFSPKSQIVARVWDFAEPTQIDREFFRARFQRAIGMRSALLDVSGTGGVRLVHGESDGLPGIVVDRYAESLVLQLGSAGAYRWRDTLVELLGELTGVHAIFERSDADVLALEGLEPSIGQRRGSPASAPIVFEENGLRFRVDLQHGHKTGFYLDQRDNRALVRSLAAGREVLDCFCYTGAFTASALAGGASAVTAIDSSAESLATAAAHMELNGLAGAQIVEADVFQTLRRLRDQGRSFDLIILDPPKFAPTAALAERAARGYKDINLYAFKLLRPGGLLLTFSCSGGVSRDLFQKIVAGAALDAGVDGQILRWLNAAPDHPVALAFPEGEYLKGLLCRAPT
ncbi:MAG TPA: class I SAM-dependent methyltransferase [Burkholderiales bacterium]|nr:class I SAM-dependent methyltransferase [Burkholderiales bacterium]